MILEEKLSSLLTYAKKIITYSQHYTDLELFFKKINKNSTKLTKSIDPNDIILINMLEKLIELENKIQELEYKIKHK